MNEKKLCVWQHKTEKGIYLVRNRECIGGSTAQHFFRVTDDFSEAVRNFLQCDDMEFEQYLRIPYSCGHKVDDTVPFVKQFDAEIDGYKGMLRKEVRYSLKDFEKVVLWKPKVDKRKRIKPCPFCGKQPTLQKVPLDRQGYSGCYEYVVECENPECMCRVKLSKNNTIYYHDDEAKMNAMIAWNRRTGSSEGA